MHSRQNIFIIFLIILSGNLFSQDAGKGIRGVFSADDREIQATRDDFIYEMELLPGQEFSGYIYHWSQWDEAWGDLYEDPEVEWLEVSPATFIAQGCEKPVPVKFTFKAPQQTGTYSTTVIDDEWNWPDNQVTLTVTNHPSYKMYDSTIIVEVTGSTVERYQYHEYHGLDPTQSWWDDGYCGDDPYVFSPTRKIVHTIIPPKSNVAIQPDDFTLLLDRDTIVTKIFQLIENEMDSFYEMVSSQWRSYPEFIKWKLVPADSYCLGWEQIPSLNVASVLSGAEVYDDYIYLAGGLDPMTNEALGRVEVFDGMGWTVSAATLNEPRYGFAHAMLDEKIYLFGGLNGNHQPISSAEYYSNGNWHLSPDTLPGAVAGHCGAAYSSFYYVFGGKTVVGYLSALWRFSAQQGWTVLSATLPFGPREGYQCIRLGRHIYILGGSYSEDGTDTVFYPDVHLYDPSTGHFSQAAPMQRARADFVCGVVDGLLYVAGGRSDEAATAASIEFYDPATGIWLSCNDSPDISIHPAAYTVKDNHLFLLGGRLSYPNTPATYRTCYGSGQLTIGPEEPQDDPGPVLQAFPNPLRDQAVITFVLPYDSKVTIQLFDVRGRLMETLVDEYLTEDKYQFRIDGRLLAEGLYLARLQTEKHKVVKKIVKVKHYK
jgi:N-acetylneuraminic acid mutarotase